ncbi:MAG: FKBP-type peptidyl-prolyl cis-trans isomerase [Prevotella sp.]|nr:FKBP-type peptidyl-prolyl cis-trans isomerase [Prevotella sp.]
MKKISLLAVMAIAAVGFTACGNSTPKEEMKSDVDSLSYALGIDQGQGVKQYLQQMQIDTAYIDEFVKGLNDGAKNADDKKRAAYNAGIGIGMQMNMVIKQQINRQIFGQDSTKTISLDNFLAGFAASAKGKGQKMTVEQARTIEQNTSKAIQTKNAEKTYGANKKKSDAYMAANAKKAGVRTIGQGVQVKELKKGTGAVPKATDVVKINYVGKTIEGKEFDHRDGATMPVGGVIPGFTEALTKMPVGSKWEITIPYTAGYGAQQPSPDLKPFSTLVFTVELLEIEKAPQGQPAMPVGQPNVK